MPVFDDGEVRWDRLFHAHGPAGDGLSLLAALRRGDEVELSAGEAWWQQPYSFLWSALYCLGRLTPATAPSMRYLARTVTEPDFGGPDPTLRDAVVWWFREIARTVCTGEDLEAARRTAAARDDPAVIAWLDTHLRERRTILGWTEADAPGRVLLAASLVDCFDLLPEVFTAIKPLLEPDSPPRLRIVAASAAAMLVRHPRLAVHRADVLAYHLAECASDDPYHRASMLIGVGELGGAPRAWLDDPHPGVRVCAAFAPALTDDADAVEVLVSASRDPHAFDTAFGTTVIPQLVFHAPMLAETVCRRVADFDRLVDSAIATIPVKASAVLVDGDWHPGALCEPYLRAAFPDGLPPTGTATGAQRALAAAVAGHEPPWHGDAAWSATLTRCRLPLDRAAWAASAGCEPAEE